MPSRPRCIALTAGLLLAAVTVPAVSAQAAPASSSTDQALTSYLVVFDAGTTSAVANQVVTAAGGTVTSDLTGQIGVLTASSAVPGFDAVLRASGLVVDAAEDLRFLGLPGTQSVPGGGPAPSADLLESQQWDMQQIHTEEAHAVQAGSRAVDVGILDSGIDGRHVDFMGDDGSNVDCARGRDFVPLGPGLVSNPDPCTDNQFHGTHVAGSVAARANGIGVVGVAPNITLVPVKVCDAEGYCYASSVVEGITYAGDAQLDVINMSFFVDDDEYQQSTEFKCNDDPVMRTFRRAVERASSTRGTRASPPSPPWATPTSTWPTRRTTGPRSTATGATWSRPRARASSGRRPSARSRRRPSTPTTAPAPPTSPPPVATGRRATAGRRSCRPSRATPTSASRARRWPARTRPASPH